MTDHSQPSTQMPMWRVWFLAVRPWSLTISIVPIVLATALAWTDGRVSIVLGILMLLTSILTHIACNLTNDYFDDVSGVDVVQKEGHGRMLQEGHLSNRDLLRGMIVAFALALLCGTPIILQLGWIGIVLAIIGAGVAFLYTGGPWPLAYNRLGEIGVFIAMGLVMVGGAFYVHTGTLTWPAAILATNIGLYAAAVLHANNMRDIEVDADHAKHTIANTFGWKWGIREYILLVVAPLLLTTALVIGDPGYWPMLASLLVVPATLAAINHMRSTEKGTLTSAIVGQSARLHQRYGVLATIALVVTGLVQR